MMQFSFTMMVMSMIVCAAGSSVVLFVQSFSRTSTAAINNHHHVRHLDLVIIPRHMDCYTRALNSNDDHPQFHHPHPYSCRQRQRRRTRYSQSSDDDDYTSNSNAIDNATDTEKYSSSPSSSSSSSSRRNVLKKVIQIASSTTTAALIGNTIPLDENTNGIGIGIGIAAAMTTNPTTGIALPDLGEIENSIPKEWTNVDNPFLDSNSGTNNNGSTISTMSRTMFGRLDTKPDSIFYTEPRFVEHVDKQAVQIMTEYISTAALTKHTDANTDTIAVLDLCSSWTSHISLKEDGSAGATQAKVTRISGLGMNAQELKANPVLTDWTVQDLNTGTGTPEGGVTGGLQLPYDDGTFDVVLCQLSIDYLTQPFEVLREVLRVLKVGGTVHILYSNRLFLTKAVGLWSGADDIDHTYYVGCYLHFCSDTNNNNKNNNKYGRYDQITAQDLSKRNKRNGRIIGDPMYVVRAVKES